MALFENFPYTNLHELNLDWLINILNELKNSQVISVNGQTGEVILYQDAQMLLPEVTNDHWSIGRVADGTYRGIMFGNNDLAYIVHGDRMAQLYAANNPPPYPVTSVNGQTGDVVLYSEASVHLPSLTDAEIHKWNIWRWINNTMSGIEFDDTGKAYLIVNANRYNIYTSNDQPPYPVTSVNEQTGDVELDIPDAFVDDMADAELTIAENIPDSSVWALLRETANGYVGIAVNNGVNPAAYLQIGTGTTAQRIQLLTNADIPQSAGVISINGLTGVVMINGSQIAVSGSDGRSIAAVLAALDAKTGADIDVSGTDSRKINVALSSLEIDINNNRAAFVYDENGNTTAEHNIAAGKYVFWNNGAYKAESAIAIGDTLSSTNLTAVPDGGVANELNEHLEYHSLGPVYGSNTITLPAKAHDIIAIARFRTAAGAIQNMHFLFPIATIGSQKFAGSPTQGYYLNATTYAFCQLLVDNSAQTIKLQVFNISGTDFLESSQLDVFYKV